MDFSDERGVAGQMADVAPARTVPTLKLSDGTVISESLAIAEELASRHPDLPLWPEDPSARAIARNLSSEMHAGFGALREYCPMHLGAAYKDVPVPEDVARDVARIEDIWSRARNATKPEGPWLAGGYSIADAFYAPVAMRIAGYGLVVGAEAQAYVDAHLADPALRRWRAMGLAGGPVLPWYNRDYAQTTWPGPAPMTTEAVDAGPSENDTCPYSGEPVTHFARIETRVFGFCNAFCRDKTVIDAAAWPRFMEIYQT